MSLVIPLIHLKFLWVRKKHQNLPNLDNFNNLQTRLGHLNYISLGSSSRSGPNSYKIYLHSGIGII